VAEAAATVRIIFTKHPPVGVKELGANPIVVNSHTREPLTLDFDLETLAAGFADPDWVPQKITCAAWSWIGSDKVEALITGKDGFFNKKTRGERLQPLLDAIREADVVTGHNLLRFDLPVLNAECIRTGQEPLKSILVQDTIRLPKTKGLKKGQDVLGRTLGGVNEKQAMHWGEWDDAYEVDGWPEVIGRCKTDVIGHKEMRQNMLDRGLMKPSVRWNP
jgi:DNA polymerase elongation subunit (family B)